MGGPDAPLNRPRAVELEPTASLEGDQSLVHVRFAALWRPRDIRLTHVAHSTRTATHRADPPQTNAHRENSHARVDKRLSISSKR